MAFLPLVTLGVVGALLATDPGANVSGDGNGPPQILVLDLSTGNLDPVEVTLLDGLVVQALSRHDALQVLSSRDIQQMVDVEAQKQVLGCDTESCLAEIAGAMGARYVVYGQVGKLGGVVLLQLNLFDSLEGKSVSREKVEAPDMAVLGRLVEPTADRLVTRLTGVATADSVAAPAETEGALPAGWLVAGAGGAGVLVGAAAVGVGLLPVLAHGGVQDELSSISETRANLVEAKALQDEAAGWSSAWSTWGAPLVVVGALITTAGTIAAAGGAGWALLDEEPQ